MKTGSYRYDINRPTPRPRHGHKVYDGTWV